VTNTSPFSVVFTTSLGLPRWAALVGTCTPVGSSGTGRPPANPAKDGSGTQGTAGDVSSTVGPGASGSPHRDATTSPTALHAATRQSSRKYDAGRVTTLPPPAITRVWDRLDMRPMTNCAAGRR
jgi:hypothetical protein